MNRKIAAFVAAAVFVCGGAGVAYSSAPEPSNPKPSVLNPKVEPDENKDVIDLRFEKEFDDSAYVEVFAACEIKNHSNEMSDYLIEVEAVYPAPGVAEKAATIKASHVPSGVKVACPRGSFMADFDPIEWKLTTIRIDRTSTKHRDDYPDEQLSSEYLGLHHGKDGVRVDYSLTNNAERKSEYVVTYEILDANLMGIYRGHYKTKGLDYLENQSGSIPVPEEVVQKLKASLDYGERLEDLKEVRLLDVDRIIYE